MLIHSDQSATSIASQPAGDLHADARPIAATSPLLGKLGDLRASLAQTNADIAAAQSVRYKVFYEELGAAATTETRHLQRDADRFDAVCDHLLITADGPVGTQLVGTCRFLLNEHAHQAGGYYSQTEFDLSAMIDQGDGKRFMELGRSCIVPSFRSKRVTELLWQGAWAYALANRVDVLFGCASLSGTDVTAHLPLLGWLGTNHVGASIDCPAIAAESVNLEDFSAVEPPRERWPNQLPPLLKGYLRLGAKIGPYAVIDRQFGTIDVLVVLETAQINPRYLAHFGTDASRYAA
ncbi:MAG: GNAT family N-acetyltransferase [Ahrensia sp.]|nr:GNAT family N-acetyltransferase [Ahrensia sp.]